MLIGIPNEPEQNLVSAPPDSVRKLVTLGYTVRVEHAAGNAASFPDEQYLAAGAEILESK
ncbi:MAG: NAD(P)(+) transhydrogenase (Re/Si-specific) subunit alpha, partial [Ancrocorticia sp.]|nr:NAD(P)(+) transhydrogenase (Re/Si-specific) subunit alpha [Ancrocorticia sp.]